MLRDDYLIRLIRQLVAALARMATRREAGDFDGALAEGRQTWDELIGQPPRELVDLVDTHTLADILKQPERMRAAARLLVEEGRAHAGKGDPVHASLCYRRAFELLLEARVLEPTDDDQLLLTELARLVPANQLDARYRGGSYGG